MSGKKNTTTTKYWCEGNDLINRKLITNDMRSVIRIPAAGWEGGNCKSKRQTSWIVGRAKSFQHINWMSDSCVNYVSYNTIPDKHDSLFIALQYIHCCTNKWIFQKNYPFGWKRTKKCKIMKKLNEYQDLLVVWRSLFVRLSISVSVSLSL